MRIMVIVLSSFTTLILMEPAAISIHLAILATSGIRTAEAPGCLGFFGAWTLATALVYSCPAVAGWLFLLAGVIGIYVGTDLGFPVLIVWGCLAFGLALLTVFAGQEKRMADRIEWQREQQAIAVHMALQSLYEAVPEMLTRPPDADERDHHPSGLVELRPHSVRDAARR